MGTFGDANRVVALFEERGREPRFLAGHDAGGIPHNAAITARVVKGRRHYVRVRPYSAWGPGETAVMCW